MGLDYRQIIGQLIGLHNAGVLPVPGLATPTVEAPAEPGSLPVDILSKILRFYESNRGLFSVLLPLIQSLLNRGHAMPPIVLPPVVVAPPPPPAPPAVKDPVPVVARKIAAIQTRLFWVNRKNTPWVEGGGRTLLPSDQVAHLLSLEDPLQGGDRVCFDNTPVDQFGRPFVPGDAANVLMKGIVHHVTGGVGELQLQDPENLGFDPTPVVFVPWEPDSGVRPGFVGELGYYCTYEDPDTGAEIRSNDVNLRIRPWA